MKRSIPTLLLPLVLAACGSSTPVTDAGADVITDLGADASDVRDVSADIAPDVALDVPLDVRADVEPFCDIPGTYTYGLDGGFVPSRTTVTLSPGRQFTFTRRSLGVVDAGDCCTCTNTLDYCGTSDGGTIDTLGVIYAFNDSDVMAAFADQASTLYGRDTRPADGQVFVVTRGDGRHFEVGDACGGAMGCREIPAGLSRLRTLLTNLQTQELGRRPCSDLGA